MHILKKIDVVRIWSRPILRTTLTVLWAVVALVALTLFQQNIEVASSLFGLDGVLANGLGAIFKQQPSQYVLWSFFFLSGVVVAVWGEYFMRRLVPIQTGQASLPKRNWARAVIWLETKREEHTDLVADVTISDAATVHNFSLSALPSFVWHVEIGLKQPFEKAGVLVFGLSGGISWAVTKISLTHIRIQFQGTPTKYPVSIEIVEDAVKIEKIKLNTSYALLEANLPALPRHID